MMENLPKDKEVILFDGVCNLCNSSVTYIIKRDNRNRFLFSPLQSEFGEFIRSKYEIDPDEVDSIILYNQNTGVSYKSTAALKIAKHLKFPTNLAYVFMIIPAFIRNWVYDYVARNRYKWYGKRAQCMIPTPELRSKFIN